MFDILTVSDVEALPDIEWLVQGVLPCSSFAVLFGQPGSGKSFIALSLALSCAAGTSWLGRATKPANILYIAAEGVLGFKKRLRAYRHRMGLNAKNVRFVAVAAQLADPKQIAGLIADLQSSGFIPDLIIIDTLARVSEGIDENSAKEMGTVIRGVGELIRITNAAVLLVHHTSKAGVSERGSSALRGAADVMILCEAGNSADLQVVLKCEKMKDDEPFKDIGATLEKVELPGGASSLIVGEAFDVVASAGEAADRIVEILEMESSATGLTHGKLRDKFVELKFGAASTFARAWKYLKETDRVRFVKENGKNLIFAASVSAKPVSN